MKFALCTYNGSNWMQIDREVEAADLMDALSRISDRYKPENLAYFERSIPDEIDFGVIGYDLEHKIQAVKELRGCSGHGLREAKDMIDLIESGRTFVSLGKVTLDEARKLVRQDFTSLKLGPNPSTTDDGVLMVLKLQGGLGRSR